MNSRRDDLAAIVAEEAQLESLDEAGEVIRAVTGAMADHFEPEAWRVVADVVPPEYLGAGGGGGPASRESVRDFFMDIGDREGLGTAPSARYARIVAEAIRSRMRPDQVDRLDESLTDDFLALFETDQRGELTGSPGPTRSGEIQVEDESE